MRPTNPRIFQPFSSSLHTHLWLNDSFTFILAPQGRQVSRDSLTRAWSHLSVSLFACLSVCFVPRILSSDFLLVLFVFVLFFISILVSDLVPALVLFSLFFFPLYWNYFVWEGGGDNGRWGDDGGKGRDMEAKRKWWG